MKESKEIPIELAFLHQAVVWPGRIGSEKTLSHQRIPGMKMFLKPEGLVITIRDQQAIIPSANVAIAILEPL